MSFQHYCYFCGYRYHMVLPSQPNEEGAMDIDNVTGALEDGPGATQWTSNDPLPLLPPHLRPHYHSSFHGLSSSCPHLPPHPFLRWSVHERTTTCPQRAQLPARNVRAQTLCLECQPFNKRPYGHWYLQGLQMPWTMLWLAVLLLSSFVYLLFFYHMLS